MWVALRARRQIPMTLGLSGLDGKTSMVWALHYGLDVIAAVFVMVGAALWSARALRVRYGVRLWRTRMV